MSVAKGVKKKTAAEKQVDVLSLAFRELDERLGDANHILAGGFQQVCLRLSDLTVATNRLADELAELKRDMARSRGPAASPDPAERFDVRLVGVTKGRAVDVIKAVRACFNTGLKEAKEMVMDSPLPRVLVSNSDPESAERISRVLAMAGATVEKVKLEGK